MNVYLKIALLLFVMFIFSYGISITAESFMERTKYLESFYNNYLGVIGMWCLLICIILVIVGVLKLK